VAQQRVSLVALALPRLSRYRDTGALAMELPFNRELALTADAQPSISLMVDAADQLYACTAEAASASTHPPPSRRWTPHLRCCPPHRRWRPLPRSSASRSPSAAASPAARLPSAQLADAGGPAPARFAALPQAHRRRSATSTDRIGLSRNAFSFEAVAKGYTIARLSATQALYHLDDKLQFVASVGDAPYLLPHGHHLVAGHYVLRFEA
jgi:hypothetical protein